MSKITFSDKTAGIVGISGHAGVGHVHSHSGFVQDDSAGLTVAANIVKKALPVQTEISSVEASPETGVITVRTMGGGEGSASPRRGISPYEAELMISRAPGLDTAYSQNCAVRVFGRLYGQGIAECASSFQCACALALLDTFVKAAPDRFHVSKPASREAFLDKAITTVLDVDGIPMSIMLLVNATRGGIGPAEDFEGNVPWDFKKDVMDAVGLVELPTIILESKAYIPAMAGDLKENTLMLRAEEGVDNVALAETLKAVADAHEIPAVVKKNVMPLKDGGLEAATIAFADRVIAAAQKLRAADDVIDKVTFTAELAELVSQDAGGVTFMGNTTNNAMRGAGIIPGKNAILSMICTTAYKEYIKTPMLTESDAAWYETLVLEGMHAYATKG